MNAPLGSADFFTLEAGECLDRLERVLTQADAPDASEMLRAARALRGAALMANQTPIARAAAGFESLARGIRDRGRETVVDGTLEPHALPLLSAREQVADDVLAAGAKLG